MTPAAAGSQWAQKLNEAQQTTAEGARLEFAKDYAASFEAYVRAGQTYLWLLRTHDSVHGEIQGTNGSAEDTKSRLKKAAQKVLDRAELIKKFRNDVKPVRRRVTSVEEQDAALAITQSPHLKQVSPMSGMPGPSTYEGRLYSTSTQPKLSKKQSEKGSSYMRIRDIKAFQSPAFYEDDYPGRDIVQDGINDCSFVAGLIVCREHDSRWGTHLAHAPLYPKDTNNFPRQSANGRYDVCFNLNGSKRYVTIDDQIPCSAPDSPMCTRISSRQTSKVQLWPALLEKAYITLRGTYDFHGSDSSIDIHALTGWVPEQVGFRHAGFQKEKTWTRLLQAFQQSQVLVTAGTGKSVCADGTELEGFLVCSHNYAVVDVREEGDSRMLSMVNPWTSSECSAPNGISVRDAADIRTMSWDDICANFDSLFLNWNPETFPHRTSMHAIWRERPETPSKALEADGCRRVFIALDAEPAGDSSAATVWLHLARHQKFDMDEETASSWIALHVIASRNEISKSTTQVGRFVDSPHILSRSQLPRGQNTVVVSLQGEFAADTAFTLTAFSKDPLKFAEPPLGFQHVKEISGQWTSRSSGGSPMHATFIHNPQYFLQIPEVDGDRAADGSIGMTDIRIVLETSRDNPAQIFVLWSTSTSANVGLASRRIDRIAPGDVYCSSGVYSYGLAVADVKAVRPGSSYCIVLSTYSPGQLGEYVLRLESNVSTVLQNLHTIPAEGAGMHRRTLRGAWRVADGTACGAPRHGRYMENPSFAFEVARKMTCTCRLTVPQPGKVDLQNSSSTAAQRSPINIAIFDRKTSREVVSSGGYTSEVCGAAIQMTTLEQGEYVAVVSTFDANIDADFVIDCYSQQPVKYTRLR